MSSSKREMASTEKSLLQIAKETVTAYYNVLQLKEDEEKKKALKCFHRKAKMTVRDGKSTRFGYNKKYRREILVSLGFTDISVEHIDVQQSLGKEGFVALVLGSVTASGFSGRRKFAQTFYLFRTGKTFKILNDIFCFIGDVPDLPSSISSGTIQSGESLDVSNVSPGVLTFPSTPFVTFDKKDNLELAEFRKSLGLSPEASTTTESEQSLEINDEQLNQVLDSSSSPGTLQSDKSHDEPLNQFQNPLFSNQDRVSDKEPIDAVQKAPTEEPVSSTANTSIAVAPIDGPSTSSDAAVRQPATGESSDDGEWVQDNDGLWQTVSKAVSKKLDQLTAGGGKTFKHP